VLVREAAYRSGREEQDPTADGQRFDVGTLKLETLLEDPDSRAVLDELLPELTAHPALEHIKNLPLDVVLGAGDALPPDVLADLRARLAALPLR
jgi:hypothetical protein